MERDCNETRIWTNRTGWDCVYNGLIRCEIALALSSSLSRIPRALVNLAAGVVMALHGVGGRGRDRGQGYWLTD